MNSPTNESTKLLVVGKPLAVAAKEFTLTTKETKTKEGELVPPMTIKMLPKDAMDGKASKFVGTDPGIGNVADFQESSSVRLTESRRKASSKSDQHFARTVPVELHFGLDGSRDTFRKAGILCSRCSFESSSPFSSSFSSPKSRARNGIESKDRDAPPGLDAFEMESGNDPVVSETEGELRVVV